MTHQFALARSEGFRTLVGHGYQGDEFPRPHGNCFGVFLEKRDTVTEIIAGREYKIVNFYAENFDELP